MPKQTYLLKRNGVYYCRMAIPRVYQDVIGKKEIWKSLGVGTYAEASQRIKAVAGEVHAWIMSKAKPELNEEIIKNIAEEHYKSVLAKNEFTSIFTRDMEDDFKVKGIDLGKWTPSKVDKLGVQDYVEDLTKAMQEADYKQMQITANMKLEMAGIKLNSESIHQKNLYKILCLSLLDAHLRAYKTIQKRKDGNWEDGLYSCKMRPLKKVLFGSANDETESLSEKKTLKNLIDEYNAAEENLSKSDEVKLKNKTYQHVISSLLGEKTSLKGIDKNKCRQFVKNMKLLPNGVTKLKKYKGLTPLEAIEKSKNEDIKRLNSSSINDYIEHLSSLLKWGAEEGYEAKDLLGNLKVKDTVKAKDKKYPFTIEQLNVIFSDKGLLQFRKLERKQHRYWIPVIGLFTGMRLGEIIQLRVSDIKTVDGVEIMSVNMEGEGKSVKTSTSIREVPIHKGLKKEGFMNYVKKIKKEHGARGSLFPHNKMGKGNKKSNYASQEFSRLITDIGVKEDKKLSFHSFRHNFKDFAINSKKEGVIKRIGGWSEGNAAYDRYGSGLSLQNLAKEYDKIKFEGVKFLE